MDDIPSISSGSVGSRFVSQSELESAKERREEQWKAAYARLGQEPPPQPAEEVFDGRSLAEKLAANRAAKQEEWEAKNKLGNQFRALEEDEVLFLDSVREKQRTEERLREEMDGKELQTFREAVAARENASKPPPMSSALDRSAPPTLNKPLVSKKDNKKALKGVLVKKKPRITTSAATVTASDKQSARTTNDSASGDKRTAEDSGDAPQSKRKKLP